jgi:hypothetical protein
VSIDVDDEWIFCAGHMKHQFPPNNLSPRKCPGQPMLEFKFLIHQLVTHISTNCHYYCQSHTPALSMPVSAASTSHTQNSSNHYQPLTLSLLDISCTLAMAASHIHACIS